MPSFKLNEQEYSIPSDLTMGEMCDAEQFFGVEFGNAASSGARMTAALMWIAVRRSNPKITPEEVREAIRELPLEVLNEIGADASPPDEPPSGGNARSGGSSSNSSAGQDETPQATGDPGSAITSRSDLLTSPV